MADIATLGIQFKSNLSTQIKNLKSLVDISDSAEKAINKLSNAFGDNSRVATEVSKTQKESISAIEKMIWALQDQEKKLALTRAEYVKYRLSLLGATESEKQLADSIVSNISKIQSAKKAEADIVKANAASYKQAMLEQQKAMSQAESAEKSRVSTIQSIIGSLSKEEQQLTMTRSEMLKYNLALLGATDSEKKQAETILKNITSIKQREQANKDALNAEQKRVSSIKSVISGLESEVNTIGKSKAQIADYKLSLLGASTAEREHAKALAEKVQKLEESNNKTNNSKIALMAMAGAAGAAAAVVYSIAKGLKSFGESVLETAKIADNFKYSLLAVSDSSEQAAETYKYLEKEANRLGQSITGNVDSFTGFIASAKAAGLTAEQSRKIYTGLNEAMTALHRSPEQAGQALYALQQMLASGTVRAQELNIQLANAIPGAVPMFAQAMGKTTSELKDLMKEGLVPANEAVIKFTDYLSGKFGASAEAASNSVQGSLNKMDNALYNLKKAIVDAMGDNTTGIIKDITEKIKEFTEELKNPESQAALKKFANDVLFITESFVTATKATASFIRQIAELRNKKAFDAGEFGNPIQVFIKGIQKSKEGLIDFSKFFNSSTKERIEMLMKAKKAEEENAEALKNITGETEKAADSWQPVIGYQTEATEGVNKHSKAIDKIIKKIKERNIEAGMGAEDALIAELRANGATEETIKEQQKLVDQIKSKNQAYKDAQKAERKAASDAEAAIKKAETAEKNRQERIEKIIQKLKDQIATYKQGKEVSAEVALQHENATPQIIEYAKALGRELDQMKALTKAQKAYDDIMAKTAPDQVDLKRNEAIAILNEQFKDVAKNADEYKKSLKQINDYYDTKELKEYETEVSKLAETIGSLKTSSFGNEMADGINNAVISMRDLNDYLEKNKDTYDDIKKKREEAYAIANEDEREKKIKELDDLEGKYTASQLTGYRQLFGTISQLYGENTKEREALHKIEMAFAAAEIAMNLQKTISAAYTAIATQGAGDPYTAFARVAAMTALMAGIISAAGGSLGGTKGGGSASASSASSNGGTVLGSSEGSQSISNSLDFMTDIQAKQYNELKGINDGVESLNKNITGLVTSIVRNVDIGSVSGAVSGTSGGTSNLQSIGTGLGTVGLAGAAGAGYIGAATGFATISTTLAGMAAASIPGAILGYNTLIQVMKEAEKQTNGLAAAINFSLALDTGIFGGLSDWLTDTMGNITGAIMGGSKKTTVLAQGLEVSTGKISDLLDGMGVDIQKFADIKVKKEGGLFGSDKTYLKTITEALEDNSIKTMFTSVFKSMGETMIEVAKGLNISEDIVKAFTFNIDKIDLKGLTESEDINKAISEAISNTADDAAIVLFSELVGKYQQVGETIFNTAIRVVSEKGVVEDILEMTNQSFTDAKIPEIALATTQSIIDLAGGIKNLQEISSNYYNEFFTDAEKQTRLYSQLNEAMTSIGLPMAENRDAFRNMVEGLDLSNEAQRQQYVALLSFSEAADKYYDALEGGEQVTKDNKDAVTSMVTDTQKAIAQMDMTDFEKSIQNVKDSTENQITTLRNLGASEEDIAVIRAYGQKQIDQLTQKENDSLAAQKEASDNLIATKQMELDVLNGTATEQDQLNLKRQQELKTLPESVQAIQQQIWAREDEIAAAEKAQKILDEKSSLEMRILELTGNTAEYTAKKRQLELAAINETNRPLQERIYQLEDEAEATLKAKEIADKKQSLEIELLNLTGKSAEAVALQRKIELESLDNSLKPLQERVWALQDEQAVTDDTSNAVTKKYELELQLLNLTGKSAQATAIQRQKELSEMEASLRPLQERVWALEDEAAANEKAKAISDERTSLEIQLLEAQGNSVEALALQRKTELSGIDDSNKALQERVWALQDENDANQKAKDIADQLAEEQKQYNDNVLSERLSLENELLQLIGNTAEIRRRELESIDASNRALQKRIWVLQDEKDIQDVIATANENILNTRKGLENEILQLTGNTIEIRKKELEVLRQGGTAVSERIISLKNEKETYTQQYADIKKIIDEYLDYEQKYIEKRAELSKEKEALEKRSANLILSYTDMDAEQKRREREIISERIKAIKEEELAMSKNLNALRGNANLFKSSYESVSSAIENITTSINTLEESLKNTDTEGLAKLQEQIWALEDAAKAAEKAASILEEKHNLETELLKAEGKEREYTLAIRNEEIKKIDESNRWIQKRIWQLEDEATASEKAKEAYDERIDLLKSNIEEATDILRDSIDKQIEYYESLADAANEALEKARTAIDKSFEAEQDKINRQHEETISILNSKLEESKNIAASLEDQFNSLSEARKSMEGTVTRTYKDIQKQLFTTLSSARSGNFAGVDELLKNINVITETNEDLFATREEQKRNFYKNYAALSELETLTGNQLTEQQQIVEGINRQIAQEETNNEQLIKAIKTQYDAVIGVDNTVLSFKDAIEKYQRAQYEANGANTLLKQQTESLNAQYYLLSGINNISVSVEKAVYNLVSAQANLNNAIDKQYSVLLNIADNTTPKESKSVNVSSSSIPGYANGGIHEGGLRIVGERGAELEYTPPARITSNNELKSMMSDEDVKRILSEIKDEIARGNFTIAKNTQDSAKTLKKFDYDGMPTTRTE